MAVHPVSHSAPPPPVAQQHHESAPKPALKADHGGHVTETRGTKVNKTA